MKRKISSTETYTLGVDIGGTSTQLALVSRSGVIAEKASFEIAPHHADVAEFVNNLVSSIDRLVSTLGEQEKLIGIGIGAPNGNYYEGTIDPSVNLPWQEKLPLVDLLQKKYRLPVVLTNDANAATMGEMMYGAAKGMSEFYLITLGTGIGSGIVSDGKLLHGYDGKAGELGHLIIHPHGRKCACGREGCFECYCSASGIVRTARELLSDPNVEKSLLMDIPSDSLTAKEIYCVAQQGDRIANEVFRITGEILGETLANVATFSSPQAIILFGGVTRAWPLLKAPAEKALASNCLFAIHRPEILLSTLPDSDAALLGAAALPFHKRD